MSVRCTLWGLVPAMTLLGGGHLARLEWATMLAVSSVVASTPATPGEAVSVKQPSAAISPRQVGDTPASGLAPGQPIEPLGRLAPSLPDLLTQATHRVVKLYGAGIGDEHGYATGVVVSADGLVITVLGLFLETVNLRAVTPDGHIYHAECIYRDQYRQLALLQLDRHAENTDTDASVDEQMTAIQLDYFQPADGPGPRPGDWIFSVGNNFKVADGDEPVSVLKGIVSARTRIDALHGNEPFPFRGDVYILDALTSTPGAPGSALIDLDGRWVGLVGKIVTNRQTNTFLNYAYPMDELRAFMRDAKAGANAATRPAVVDAPPGYHGIRLSKIAYRRQLPFVQNVAAGSPAAVAGVKPEDLIVSANGTAIPHARIFNEICERLHAGDELSLIVKREEQLVSIRFKLGEAPK